MGPCRNLFRTGDYWALTIKRSSFGGLPVLARGIISLICSHCVSLSSYRFAAM